MSDIRIKMAKDLRDMSDMVGDLHWMAAKAVEDLTKKDGEIAKRDAELAACRAAVENCDVFRARIVELEDLVLSLQCKAIESDDLRSELAAIKAQEPIAWYTEDHLDDKSATTYSREVADRWLAKGWPITGIANAADAQAIIDGLRGEVDKLMTTFVRVADHLHIDCEKAKSAPGKPSDVFIATIDQQAQRIGELEGLLRRAYEHAPIPLQCRIDAALSAGKEGE